MMPNELAELITSTIQQHASEPGTVTAYREPLVGFAAAADPRFFDLRRAVGPGHKLPDDLLPGARTVVSFFLPFAPWVVDANARHRERVAREWAVAYVETNALIGRITASLIELLAAEGIRAAAEPATHNFDHATLLSHWSHKSVAVVAGVGSFGLHQMVITDAGCAGRFGSLVLDAELPLAITGTVADTAADKVVATVAESKERCAYFEDGSCLECVSRCPVAALDPARPFDRHRCHDHLEGVAQQYADLGLVEVCGKCAIGPCSLQSAAK